MFVFCLRFDSFWLVQETLTLWGSSLIMCQYSNNQHLPHLYLSSKGARLTPWSFNLCVLLGSNTLICHEFCEISNWTTFMFANPKMKRVKSHCNHQLGESWTINTAGRKVWTHILEFQKRKMQLFLIWHVPMFCNWASLMQLNQDNATYISYATHLGTWHCFICPETLTQTCGSQKWGETNKDLSLSWCFSILQDFESIHKGNETVTMQLLVG